MSGRLPTVALKFENIAWNLNLQDDVSLWFQPIGLINQYKLFWPNDLRSQVNMALSESKQWKNEEVTSSFNCFFCLKVILLKENGFKQNLT